ncbi:hypothetical protein SAMN05421823_112170 [Catalinimonas alkaloidigena]|uniref:Uncharacterized protein n=1 Tax=Catalinimonas alkaloidigena TaxID=1075417 RepID=A0A1G9SHS5_9BACT|nr:DUF4230 domain-containing protein [Catalinimonas alkaloidigena]SDM35023.1 hypothetical protein SAMN05421823_112170 [Catalinimonas alkaloidigena]
MISLILKNWRFLFDALLIVGLVVLLFLWNPFGMFGGGLKLETTTNMVTEVRQIGQLITAEYYGEVIASLEESRLELVFDDSLNDEAQQQYVALKQALFQLYQYQQRPKDERTQEFKDNRALFGNPTNWRRLVRHEVDRQNIQDKLHFHELLQPNDASFDDVLEYLWRERIDPQKKSDWDPAEKDKGRVLFAIYTELADYARRLAEPALQAYLHEGFEETRAYSAFFHEDRTSKLTRVERKKRLAMVGRGWVKAGFDFGTLDASSFYFDEEHGELHFFGLQPRILNADINPWFIPERGVPGFDIIDYAGQVSFKDAKQVKLRCLEKLVAYAHRAQILARAQQQGEATLQAFFSLVTGKEVQRVFFHNDALIVAADDMARDEYLNAYEAHRLDSLVRREEAVLDSLARAPTNRSRNLQLIAQKEQLLRATLGKLRKLPFEAVPGTFSYFSALAYRVGQDSILEPHEEHELERAFWISVQRPAEHTRDSVLPRRLPYWLDDSLAFMMDYNRAVAYLLRTCPRRGQLETQGQRADADVQARLLQDSAVVDYRRFGDSVQVTYLRGAQDARPYLLTQLHPFYYDAAHFAQAVEANDLFGPVLTPRGDTTLAYVNDSTLWLYRQAAAGYDTLQALHLPPEEFLNQALWQAGRGIQAPLGSDTLYVWRAKPPVPEAPPYRLTSLQAQELASYYELLAAAQAQWQHQDPILKASAWVQAKLGAQERARHKLAAWRTYVQGR